MLNDRHDIARTSRRRWAPRALACLATLALSACASAPRHETAHPLLDAAHKLFYVHTDRNERTQGDILASLTLLGGMSQRYAATDSDCHETECRQAFSDALGELGTEYARLGLERLALRYYELALANAPDSANNHVNLAIAQLALRRDTVALESIRRALDIGKDDPGTQRTAASIFLLLDRPQEAITHADACARQSPPPRMAQYCALTAMTAGLRGGTDSQVAPLIGGDTWPAPLLDYMRGRIDEAVLAGVIAHASDPAVRREGLSESLYYVGEAQLARGHRELALRYFRANLEMKVEDSWGTTGSRRRLIDLGGSDDPPTESPPVQHVPIG